MTEVCLNLGSPVRRDAPFRVNRAGVWVEDVECRRGEHFVPTADERKRLAYKLRVTDMAPPEGSEQPRAVATESQDESEDPVAQYATGSGWYELPDGRRVRGRANAMAALEGVDGTDG